MIIGCEGVSCTGKTTLATALAAWLGEADIVPCYYHAAPDPSVIPRPDVGSETEQLDALAVHLRIEEDRALRARDAVRRGRHVVLDRTVDTLLAHIHAVGRMNSLDANAAARAMVAEQIERGRAVVPNVTLLLRAEPDVLAARACSRVGMPALYYDPSFTLGFHAHFQAPITPFCLGIDTGAAADQVLDRACRLLHPYLSGQR